VAASSEAELSSSAGSWPTRWAISPRRALTCETGPSLRPSVRSQSTQRLPGMSGQASPQPIVTTMSDAADFRTDQSQGGVGVLLALPQLTVIRLPSLGSLGSIVRLPA
jgi:hypothetical protein